MKAGDHLFLVDGSAYIFRAYHALPPLTRKSDNLPVGAVAGFCNMLWKLLREARDTELGVVPTHFAVIFDYSSKTFRNELYPQYKANRSEPPDDLKPQFSLIRDATRAFGVPCIEAEGFEADDLIATYARQAREKGGEVTIISSDKDLMQLIRPGVIMYDQMKDKTFAEADVVEKWGVNPDKMIDLQALTGDSTDNIPGVPGIGPKTAAQLLSEYGDLDTLLARAGEIKQIKRRENLIEFADKARISRRLVSLKDDVPLETAIDDLALAETDGPTLIAFLKAMEFNALTGRVAQATQTQASEVDAAAIKVASAESSRGPDLQAGSASSAGDDWCPDALAQSRRQEGAGAVFKTDAYQCISDEATLLRWIERIREAGQFAIDLQTTSIDPMVAELIGISIAVVPGEAAYLPLAHVAGAGDLLDGGRVEGQLSEQTAVSHLKPLLEDTGILKIGHNIKYHWLLFAQRSIVLSAVEDVMLVSYVLDAGRADHGIVKLAREWLGHELTTSEKLTGSGRRSIGFDAVEPDRAAAFAAERVDAIFRLWRILNPRLAADGLTRVYERLERPLIPVIARMEQRGIAIDRQILSRLSGELAQAAAAVEDEIYERAGETFNIGSPKQLGEILFGKLNLPGARKTKTGQWSTSVQVLDDLAAEGHELPRRIVGWRQLTKLKSTYTDALPHFINERTGRVHTSYALASTSTGRLSSSEPNLQNIPVRTEEGRKIRTAFVAARGRKLVSADYSQIELRILAHIAEIPQLRKAFDEGLDIHAMTASEMFNTPIRDMDPLVRRRAKAINFGIIYGISAFGLANQLGIERSEAAQYIKTYFERFPGIRDYMEETKQFARENGYVQTIFGRRAHYPDIKAANPQIRSFNERAAINAPIQGSAADIIRRAMIRMDDAIANAGVDGAMLLQVHDELVFEMPQDQVDAAIPVIVDAMREAPMPAVDLAVPLEVEARAADNWEAAH